MKNNFLIVLVALFSGINSYAITPQKYCESLAATSCEVLNIDAIRDPAASTGAPIGWDVKYCRDRVLKNRYIVKAVSSNCFMPGASMDYNRQCIYVENASRTGNNNVYIAGNVYTNLYESIDGSLCSKTYTNNGSNVLNVLP